MSNIFTDLIMAIGGETAVNRVQSITASADCIGSNGPYTTNLKSTRSGKLFFEQLRPEQRPFQAWIIDKEGWAFTQANEKQALGIHHIAMIKSHDFQMIPINFQQRYAGIEVQEELIFNETQCHQVQFLDEIEQICHAYFDVNTYLWAGMALANSLTQDGSIVIVTINHWQTVDDILLPQSITATDKTGDFHLQFKNIQLNNVDEKIFE